MKELSIDEKIRRIVEHFKQDDPLGIPGVPIPDPKEIPDIEKDITGAKVILTDAKMHDMSKFRIDYVRTDLKDLKVKKFRPFFSFTSKSLQPGVAGKLRPACHLWPA